MLPLRKQNFLILFLQIIKPTLLETNNHAKGLLHLACYLDDLDARLKNPEEVYPAYLSGTDQWKRVK